MTGLLHRLAARANGSAWTVRSDARLPFASETWAQAAIETPAPATEPATLLQPSAAVLAPDSLAAEAGEPITQLHAPNAPRLQQEQAASQDPDTLMAASATPNKTVQQHQQPFATDTLFSGQPQAIRTLLPQPTPGAPATSRPAPARAHAPLSFAQNEPEPLLPPMYTHSVAASARLAPRAHLGAWASTAQPAAREDTEVHIHIGRIDVTAVHEAPKSKPSARERTQPVSLDAYLAARQTK